MKLAIGCSCYMKWCFQEADESLNFDEMILEAAKSIITATSALVRAASAAQRELIDQVCLDYSPRQKVPHVDIFCQFDYQLMV